MSCKVCKKSFDSSWAQHLGSQGHQRLLTRLPRGGLGAETWVEAGAGRHVEILGATELSASPSDIVEYLTEVGGELEDFICPTSLSGTKPAVIHALYKEAASKAKLLEVKDPQIFGQRLRIKGKVAEKTEKDEEKSKSPKTLQTPAESHSTPDCTSNGSGTPKTTSKRLKSSQFRPKTNKTYPKLTTQLKPLTPSHELGSCARSKLAKELQKILAATFSSVAVLPFGADVLGVPLPSDKVRLCVDPYGKFAGRKSGPLKTSPSSGDMSVGLIHQIMSTATQQPSGIIWFDKLELTQNAAGGSEISFEHTSPKIPPPAPLECVLTFESFLSVAKVRLLKFYVSHDQRVRDLFSLLKRWAAKSRVFPNFGQDSGLEAYLLLLMMITYLSDRKIIPCVLKLKENAPKVIIDGVDASYSTDRRQTPSARVPGMGDEDIKVISVLGLLQGFFAFYSALDFDTSVIVSCLGEVRDRGDFRPINEAKALPPGYLKYYRFNPDGGRREGYLDIFAPLVVQDMFDLGQNVGSHVTKADLEDFKAKAKSTAAFLRKMMTNGNGNMSKYFGSDNPNEESESSSSEEEEEPTPPTPTPEVPKISSTPKSKTTPSPAKSLSLSLADDDNVNYSPVSGPSISPPRSRSPSCNKNSNSPNPSPSPISPKFNHEVNLNINLDEIPLPTALQPPPPPFQLPGFKFAAQTPKPLKPILKNSGRKPGILKKAPPPPKISGSFEEAFNKNNGNNCNSRSNSSKSLLKRGHSDDDDEDDDDGDTFSAFEASFCRKATPSPTPTPPAPPKSRRPSASTPFSRLKNSPRREEREVTRIPRDPRGMDN